jgi:hypothetical protein
VSSSVVLRLTKGPGRDLSVVLDDRLESDPVVRLAFGLDHFGGWTGSVGVVGSLSDAVSVSGGNIVLFFGDNAISFISTSSAWGGVVAY